MVISATAEVDAIEELRMRRWARENYVPPDERSRGWHPIVLDEMSRKDQDARPSESPRFLVAAGR
jgi:hypothetical protein